MLPSFLFHRPFSLFLGVGYGQTDEADGMIGIVYFFQQLFGERQYLVEGMQFMRSGDAARDLAEVVEFDFQRQCIAGKAVALETFHQLGGHMVKFCNSLPLCMPMECILRAVTGPTPQKDSMGSREMNSKAWSGWMVHSPSGLR